MLRYDMMSREQFLTRLFALFMRRYGKGVIARFEITEHTIELTVKMNNAAHKLVYPKFTARDIRQTPPSII